LGNDLKRPVVAQNAYLVFINRLGEIGIEPPLDVEVYIDTLQLKIIKLY